MRPSLLTHLLSKLVTYAVLRLLLGLSAVEVSAAQSEPEGGLDQVTGRGGGQCATKARVRPQSNRVQGKGLSLAEALQS